LSSIQTNNSALVAGNILRGIDADLDGAQKQVSSGRRVKTADDNSAYWSISTTMRSDDKALSAVQDSLAYGSAVVDVAYSGMTAALDVMDNVKSKLVAAREPGVDKTKINAEIEQLRQQIYTIVDSSSFGGQNWLHRYSDADDRDPEIVSGFTRSNGVVSVQTTNFERQAELGTNHLIDEIYHNGILTNVEFARELGTATEWVFMNGRQHDIHPVIELTDATTGEDVDGMIGVVDKMIAAMAQAAANLGALSKTVTTQTDYMADLRASLGKGIGQLVDADMNTASTRLKALQMRQQLSRQSLTIANAEPQTIMRLYQ
jgi:flagellin